MLALPTRSHLRSLPRLRCALLLLCCFFTVPSHRLPAQTFSPTPEAPPLPPPEQRRFCALIADFRSRQAAYAHESNPIRKAALLPPQPLSYDSSFRDLFGPHPQFTFWTGALRFSVVGPLVAVSFTPDCDPALPGIQFANSASSSSSLPEYRLTFVSLQSPLAQTLSSASGSSQRAVVSGFPVPVPSLSRLDRFLKPPQTLQTHASFESPSASSGASVASPDFLTRFSDVVLLTPPVKP